MQTIDVIGLAAFGYDFNAVQNPTSDILVNLSQLTSPQRRSLLQSIPYSNYLPTATNRKWNKVIQNADQLCDKIISDCQNHYTTGILHIITATVLI